MVSHLSPITWTLVRVQLWVCCGFCIVTFLWYIYRQLFTGNLQSRGQLASAELKVCKPGAPADGTSQSRHFMQIGYRTSVFGSWLMRSWMVLLGVGYVFILWGCWMSYVIFANLWFPPGAEFWLHTFESWDGLMLPWVVCFVLEHFFLSVLLVFWDAVHSHAMLPVPRMCAATHLLVQECPKVEMGVDELRKSLLVVLGEYLHRARIREILPVLQSESGHRYIEYTCVRYVYRDTAFVWHVALPFVFRMVTRSCHTQLLRRGSRCFRPRQPLQARGPRPTRPAEALAALACEAGEMHRRLRSGGLSEAPPFCILFPPDFGLFLLRQAEAAASQESCGPNSIHVPVPSALALLAAGFCRSFRALEVFSSLSVGSSC